MEERGGVIELLRREVEDLKAALASAAETRPSAPTEPQPPVTDPRLEQELAKVKTSSPCGKFVSVCLCACMPWKR